MTFEATEVAPAQTAVRTERPYRPSNLPNAALVTERRDPTPAELEQMIESTARTAKRLYALIKKRPTTAPSVGA